jgi:hypothetical protein
MVFFMGPEKQFICFYLKLHVSMSSVSDVGPCFLSIISQEIGVPQKYITLHNWEEFYTVDIAGYRIVCLL